jgi:carbamate kinase
MRAGAPWARDGGAPVVAFGGNALIPDPDRPGAAEANAAEFAAALATLLPGDSGLVLVHGNGPQVGAALLRTEAARRDVPPDPLDVLVAETQGSIGYLLSRAIGNALDREVVTIVTQVVVDPDDPSMREPSKPVGPYYDTARGAAIAEERGWSLVDVPGRGLRRVVPSPPPIEVVELDAVARTAAGGAIVIAGGGGGVPVTRAADGTTRGVEAVIDKDRTAALIAVGMEARGLVVLTEVAHVSTGFGTPEEEPIPSMTVAEARRHLDDGEFPPGSMGPKVEACIAYAGATGRSALVTSVAALGDALEGRAGTLITPVP